MPLYEYRCRSGHAAEMLRAMAVEVERCPECGDMAERVPFARIAPIRVTEEITLEHVRLKTTNGQLDIESPETRHKFRRFTEASQEMNHAYAQAEASQGHPIQGPDLWGQAKEGARQMALAGAAPKPAQKG